MPKKLALGATIVALTLILAPGAFAATAVPFVAAASAADGPVTWSVEPTPTTEGDREAFEYSVDPGTQVQDSFVITNAGDGPAEFIIYATDAYNDPDSGAFSLLESNQAPTDVGAWITPANEKLTIPAGSEATVGFNLLIPSDATPGDHTAGIIAAVLTEVDQNGSAVILEQRVGVKLFLTVSGAPTASVEIQGLTSSFNPSINPFAPGELSVNYEVRNTGNKRLDVNQSILVTGPFGIPLGSVTPEPIENLLPRSVIRVSAQLSGIGALLVAISDIRLVPGELGSAGQAVDVVTDESETASATPEPTGTASTPTPEASGGSATAVPAEPDQDTIDFASVSSQSWTIAITWTLLMLIVAVVAGTLLVVRYITGTRERMYLAIDEAAAAARADALAGKSGASR